MKEKHIILHVNISGLITKPEAKHGDNVLTYI